MTHREEIPSANLRPYAAELRQLVECVCSSDVFRASPKSCQFLRHVVGLTLNGETDLLKERLIGVMLLGRPADYDTAADAGVRVRANDVRKRLFALNQTVSAELPAFSVELPAGSYVPRFLRTLRGPQTGAAFCTEQLDPTADAHRTAEVCTVDEVHPPKRLAPGLATPHAGSTTLPRLSLYWLTGPTVAALFLCIIFLRWQTREENLRQAGPQQTLSAGSVGAPSKTLARSIAPRNAPDTARAATTQDGVAQDTTTRHEEHSRR